MGKHCGAALVVDGDENSRDLMVDLLSRTGFDCVGVEGGYDAVTASRTQRPWLVLSEVSLPDISGFELCRQLRDEFSEDLAIVLMSADRTDPIDRAAGMLVGGDDYIVKPFNPSELLARVRRLSERLGHESANEWATRGGSSLTQSLTEREREVLTLFARGSRPREIATQLSIGEKTVASHLQRVLEKLGVHDRAHAVAIAYREGLLEELATRAEVAEF